MMLVLHEHSAFTVMQAQLQFLSYPSCLSTKQSFWPVGCGWFLFLKHSLLNSPNLAFWVCRPVAWHNSGVIKVSRDWAL